MATATDALTGYEFGVMTSVYTLRAPSDRVADATMLLFLNTDAPVVIYKPERRTLAFGLAANVAQAVTEHFGCAFGAFIDAHWEEINAAAKTVREGTLSAEGR